MIVSGGVPILAYNELRNVYDLRAADMSGGAILDGQTRTLTDSLGRSCLVSAQVADNSTMTIDSSGTTCAWSAQSSIRDSILQFPISTWSQFGAAGTWRAWVYVSSFWANPGSGFLVAGLRTLGEPGTPYVARNQTASDATGFCEDGAGASNFNNSNANFANANVFVYECHGGNHVMRFGTWSGGWPSLGATRVMYAGSTNTTALATTSNGAGVDLSNARSSFYGANNAPGARTVIFGAFRFDC